MENESSILAFSFFLTVSHHKQETVTLEIPAEADSYEDADVQFIIVNDDLLFDEFGEIGKIQFMIIVYQVISETFHHF